MARYNEILVGRYNRLLQKHFQMKGEPPAPQLSTEIQATCDFHWGNEMRYLLGWNRYGVESVQSAQVGLQSGCEIRNPASSGVIAVLERIIFRTGVTSAAVTVFFGALATDLASTGQVARRLDGRQLTVGTALSLSTGTSPPSIGTALMNLEADNRDTDAITRDNLEIVVVPGDACVISCDVVNAALVVNWMWRERFLEESERS